MRTDMRRDAAMKRRPFSLTYLVYTPILILTLVPALYLLLTAYAASLRPTGDCSFVGLFVVIGILLLVCAVAVLMNLIFKRIYRKTSKKAFLVPCILFGPIACAMTALVGLIFLSDGSPKIIGMSFVFLAVGAAMCLIFDIIEIFKKRQANN